MNQKRPVFLNLTQIRLPLPGLVSILHRVSGILLFLLLPVLLWLLSCSLHSSEHFNELKQIFQYPILHWVIWILLSSLAYHLLAGIRHILMDMGLGETLKSARLSAKIVLLLSIICIVLLGVWLW